MNHEAAGIIVVIPTKMIPAGTYLRLLVIKSRLVAADDSGIAILLNVGVSTCATEIFRELLNSW
jgi:hypothetical protein